MELQGRGYILSTSVLKLGGLVSKRGAFLPNLRDIFLVMVDRSFASKLSMPFLIQYQLAVIQRDSSSKDVHVNSANYFTYRG